MPNDPTPPAAPDGAGARPGPPVALVVEDDPDVADLLQMVLSQIGFSVLFAVDGEEGIAMTREHSPVLTTIDVAMPKMNGLEATRRIREFSDGYIVIVSTRSEERDILAGFDAGADDYVPKPIRPRELRARLAAVARRPVGGALSGPTDSEAPGPAWAPAEEDAERSELHRQVAAGLSLPVTDLDGLDEDSAEDAGQDGREGMLEVGMRFVGSWIEFRGLRINPGRGLVVVDDRLVDLPQEHVDLIEILMYAGTRTMSARRLALRLRGQTETTATTTHRQDEKWIGALMSTLLNRLGEDGPSPRWIESLPRTRYRLLRPE